MNRHYDLHLLIYALSDALDMANSHRHGKRAGLVAMICGQQLGLAPAVEGQLLHACLLRDCGRPGTAQRGPPRHDQPGPAMDDPCQTGADLLARSPLLAPLAPLVRNHLTPWQDLRQHALGKDVMTLSNLAFIADRADSLMLRYRDAPLKQRQDAVRQTLNAHRHHLFEARVLDAFLAASSSDTFWQLMEPEHIQERLKALLSKLPAQPIDLDGVRQVALLFAQIADAKSPYMEGHSPRTGRLASHLGELTGMPAQDCAMLEIAGLLHDLGKLQIADATFNKIGALTPAERAQMDRQGLVAFRILKAVPGLERVATWIAYLHAANAAPNHGQGLNRAGQPREAGILTVAEAFQAMMQERPHRPPMTPPRIVSALRQMASTGQLDSQVVELLAQHVDACWSLATGVDVGIWATAPADATPRQSGATEANGASAPASLGNEDEDRLVEAVLASGIHIPAMPVALQGLARLKADPDTGPREFANLVNKDVALAGAIFRVVNSPVFRRGIKVDTTEKAVAVLGLKYSEAVVTSEAMRHALSDPDSAQAMQLLWDHLSSVAELCVRICARLKPTGITLDNAFTIGMFHDCGVALLCKRHPGYAKAIGLNGSFAHILTLDQEFQSSHTVLGQLVGKNWQLPPELTAVVRHHHDLVPPPLPEPANQLIALLQLALHMHQPQHGTDGGEWASGWQDVVHERLGVSAETVAALQEEFAREDEASLGQSG